jgi:tRNA(Met) cytidine acetyltransferase
MLSHITTNSAGLQQLNNEQQQGLAAILAMAETATPRPLLIEAKRGRGKSTLLGEAAYQLVQQGKQIIVSAMRIDQCQQLFGRLRQRLGSAEAAQAVRFIAPDALLARTHQADILLIDEAAHWPIAMLSQLLSQYPRVVLATTLHGYEGSGQGFHLKLIPQLNQQFVGWQRHALMAPIRWSARDPLETLSETLMGAPLAELDEIDSARALCFEATTFEQLSPALFDQVWALLRQAHYQTTPADIQQWLSAANLTLMLAHEGQQVIGVLLAVAEGELASLDRTRRVKGHLVPQRLRQSTGEQGLLSARWQRIMRLAIHPQRQHRGIGQALTRAWLAQVAQNTDWVSVSYGLTRSLWQFWRKLGFHSVHLGAKRDKASGCYNLIMAQTQTEGATLERLAQRHGEQLIHQLLDSARDIEAALAFALLAEVAPPLTLAQRQRLQAYSAGELAYEAVLAELWHWAQAYGADLHAVDGRLQKSLYAKLIQKKPWSSLAEGRKPFERQLKALIEHRLVN